MDPTNVEERDQGGFVIGKQFIRDWEHMWVP